MWILQGVIIGSALAMDAFAVSLSIGLNKGVRLYNKIIYCFSFSFFQFLFSLTGGLSGILFNKYVAAIPSLAGGIVVAAVGIMMILDGIKKKENYRLQKQEMYYILGISVSIDALVVGFTTLNSISKFYHLMEFTIIIGTITFLFCGLAYILARYLKRVVFICKYADYIGGIILIIFGLKMIIL
ncbi:manganese efflux pump MntP family protein [Clostridium polynesiense]|uniref:manganese efflux pump MntP n=1 Tax=Clostridium polynesiense TaxID=1325933 RepID=UPI00058DF147|nr:manganese efflux pump [Clostridium polynesiense]